MSPSPFWYVDRSAGEVTLLLISTVAILGMVRTSMPKRGPFIVEGLHTNLALLALGFGGLHILASILDPYASLGPVDALVPFVSSYRGTWLGLGVISGYVYVFAVLVSWPVRRFSRRTWLWLHRSLYVAWVLAVVHALATGTDTTSRLFLFLNLLAVASVFVTFVGVRVTEAWAGNPPLWAAIAAVSVVVVLGIAVWAFNGPLQPGWARESGTPPNLLHSR